MAEEEKDAAGGDGDKKVYITGNTFDVKDTLRAAGFRWDRSRRRWWRDVPEGEVQEAVASLEALGVTVKVAGADDAEDDAPPAEDAAKKKPAKKKKNAPTGPRITVGGKTYSYRAEIKELGFRWDPDGKQWWRAADKKEANELRRDLERLSPELSVHYIEDDG